MTNTSRESLDSRIKARPIRLAFLPRSLQNALQGRMDHELRRFTVWPLRNLLINTVVEPVAPQTLDDAAIAINLVGTKKMGRDPSPSVVSSLPDLEVRTILEGRLALTICELRNEVTHHRAYRPARAEVERCLEYEVGVLYRAQRYVKVLSFSELGSGVR